AETRPPPHRGSQAALPPRPIQNAVQETLCSQALAAIRSLRRHSLVVARKFSPAGGERRSSRDRASLRTAALSAPPPARSSHRESRPNRNALLPNSASSLWPPQIVRWPPLATLYISAPAPGRSASRDPWVPVRAICGMRRWLRPTTSPARAQLPSGGTLPRSAPSHAQGKPRR